MQANDIAELTAKKALNKKAYEEVISILMKTYGNEIYRFCVSMLNNSSDAHDVLQNVFIQAFKALKKFESKSSFRTWLYVIARNRCLDEIKKRKRFDARIDFVDELPDSAGEPEPLGDIGDDPFITKVLRDCLGKLSSSVRTALILRFQSGHSYAEAASVLDEKAGTLQARVSRALPVLRECVENNGVTL